MYKRLSTASGLSEWFADDIMIKDKIFAFYWDGINQNTGQKCQEGNYMWVVQLVNKEGETEQYKGAILLLN